jgi:BlaI family transcriptional regulator, penicillinase repressor
MRKIQQPKLLPAITEAEWVVMRVLWEGSAMTANEVVAALAGQREWKPKTVHTLLRRLTDKGALAYEKEGREFVFTPQVPASDCQLAEGRSFLDRVFGGPRLAPMLAAFVEQEALTPTEIAELRRILDEASPQ